MIVDILRYSFSFDFGPGASLFAFESMSEAVRAQFQTQKGGCSRDFLTVWELAENGRKG
jgi:hypothetical protein